MLPDSLKITGGLNGYRAALARSSYPGKISETPNPLVQNWKTLYRSESTLASPGNAGPVFWGSNLDKERITRKKRPVLSEFQGHVFPAKSHNPAPW